MDTIDQVGAPVQCRGMGGKAVVSAFLRAYVPSQILAGWIADCMWVHRLRAAGVAIWGLATVRTGFVGGLAAITGPVITGLIVGAMGYEPAFVLAAIVPLVGGLVFALGVCCIAPVGNRSSA